MSESTPSSTPIAEQVYEWLTDEDDGRACEEIPHEACRAAPRSFLLNVANGCATKLAEQLASPGLVLPWLLQTMGAPTAMAGWLVPIKQVGGLLPQLLVAGWIRGFRRRKWFWVGAGSFQAAMLAVMVVVALGGGGVSGGLAVLGLLLLFRIASGIGSVAFSDVVGKTVPREVRGRMLAYRAAFGGALALGAGVVMRLTIDGDGSRIVFAWLIGLAAALWAGAAVLFGMIPEQHGATEGGRSGVGALADTLGLLRGDGGLRRFVAVRCLLLAGELATPFLVLVARSIEEEPQLADLGLYVTAMAAAQVLSSPAWGWLADRSSRGLMGIGGGCAAGACAAGVALGTVGSGLATAWLFAALFFVLGLGHGAIRLGRKTYLVNFAPIDLKGSYKAVTNTIAGLAAIVGGAVGFLGEADGATLALLVLLVACAAGAIGALLLRPDRDTDL